MARELRAWIDATLDAGQCGIVACSALKRSYQDILVGASCTW
jgi:gluconate kinase